MFTEKKSHGHHDCICALDAIRDRCSIRAYSGKAVPEESITTLLKAAMAAPSSRNVQPWHFIVVRDKVLLQKMGDRLPYAGMTAEAPLAVVVCGDTKKGNPREEQKMNWAIDCSAATQNLLLAAHSIGLGAVWTAAFPYKERMDVVSKLLNLPDHILPLNVIPIGYPAEPPQPEEKWDPDKVVWK